ncbi:Mediator of RNA polymerase II transcription subunit 6 [Actinomortierella ambigua]|nr:Mediator of RNA polymerase II transcription subunit 6 [Actinomortierella ambigua]
MAAINGGTGQEAKVDTMNLEWRFQEWLIGMGGLTPDNVLDYFALSPFWDPSCNNAVLKMQTQFNNLGEMKQKLAEMTGVEFAVVHERFPALFIIQKQRRRSPRDVVPLAVYYVLHGNVYQSPDLYTVLANRMLTSLQNVESAFTDARKLTDFHPSSGYRWKASIDEDDALGSSRTGALASSTGTAGTAATNGSASSTTAATTSPTLQESQEYRIAVDRALKNLDLRAQQAQKQSLMQANNAAVAAAAAAAAAANARPGTPGDTTKIKQESSGAKAAAKAASKRRKKSEEASLAAGGGPSAISAASSIDLSTQPTQGRPPGSGAGQGSANTKRRKKTKPPAA